MIFKHPNRLQHMDQLIRQRKTGNADALARKLGISRRQVYYWLEELKDMGLEIDYSREAGSFVYLKPYKINITLDIKELSEEETLNTMGSVNFINNFYHVQ